MYGFDRARKWYKHKPELIIKTVNAIILWNFMFQCVNEMENREPDILSEKESNQCWIVDLACLYEIVCDKVQIYVDRYYSLHECLSSCG